MAATDLRISENSFLVKYFDMVNAKLHLVWGHFQYKNPAMPFHLAVLFFIHTSPQHRLKILFVNIEFTVKI